MVTVTVATVIITKGIILLIVSFDITLQWIFIDMIGHSKTHSYLMDQRSKMLVQICLSPLLLR